MGRMKKEYLEKIYAGWLGKIIGIRLGAPVEGWTYEKIKNIYGELDGYPVDYRDFAADDDSNGPLFFLRALEDGEEGFKLSSQAVGDALLNYAPYEHGFFWWGGYGGSTEHTAYLNLRAGIPAPRSGSVEQNGHAAAEQIGGQIFIDTWGLVCPGNPGLAADYAAKASAVTHGGNGVYGGVFVAACIAAAFDESSVRKIIEHGLSYIPPDCEYTRAVRAVMAYYDRNPGDWRECFQYIFENFGYDRYPGVCHIIPNSAVMILALLYGEGDFSKTITICTRCGWDTDCNAGNVGAIMGVVCGLEGIDYRKWRAPVNDFLVCSSVMGSMNIMDIPYGAAYIAKLAWAIAGEDLIEPWKGIVSNRIDSCHFEYPGSTHAIRVRFSSKTLKPAVSLLNTNETAFSGSRSLKLLLSDLPPGERAFVYKKTYYRAADFYDSRYDPSFSPLLYPGQTVRGCAFTPEKSAAVRLYVHNADTDEIIEGEKTVLEPGKWAALRFTIPRLEAGLIDEAGFIFEKDGLQWGEFTAYIDDLAFEGKPDYTVDFSRTVMDVWHPLHREVTQFSRLNGLWYLDSGAAHLSCAGFGEVYTGRHDWEDYTASFTLTPLTGEDHRVIVRAQGASRSYAAGFAGGGKFRLYKNEKGWRTLAEIAFGWEAGKTYRITVRAQGPALAVSVDGNALLSRADDDAPYLRGAIGLSVQNGSHCACHAISVC
ncbi:MAG: ADP-ribosylglycohydrolase family protein [Treponema sp.]|jgi:ADP-ribosylglycohydrolase|nr:ADP-ribosylglycohydrolase family protein [Treponema sp.]